MNSLDVLNDSTHKLEQAGIGTARLDVLVLLEDVTGKDRAWLLAHPEYEITSAQKAKLQKLLNRRAGHEPLAYVRGRTEFYTRNFVISPFVLEPRPESETMIDCLKKLYQQAAVNATKPLYWRIADVGTGSGALGITAQLELPSCQVELLEIDEKAIKTARANVDLFTLDIKIIQSDLLKQSPANYDVLLCNLPYVPNDYHINRAAANEPYRAIFGGPDGLDVYRQLFRQLVAVKYKPLYILCEALPPQHSLLEAIANKSSYKLAQTSDFIQVFVKS